MAKTVLPRVQAMVLCDGVEDSEYETDVYHLTGVRALIESPFPAIVAQFCVFLHMSGHQGEASIHIEIEKAVPSEAVFESEPQWVVFREPTSVVPVLFLLVDCVFPSPGVYYVEVWNEGKIIGERSIHLRKED